MSDSPANFFVYEIRFFHEDLPMKFSVCMKFSVGSQFQ